MRFLSESLLTIIYAGTLLLPAIAAEGAVYPMEGTVTNVTRGKSTGVTMTIRQVGVNAFQAIGQYDSKNLFGRFNVPGRVVYKGKDYTCLQFKGNLDFGNDGSGFESGTSTNYVMSICFKQNGAIGVYQIGAMQTYDYDQYGTMNLTCHGSIPGIDVKLRKR